MDENMFMFLGKQHNVFQKSIAYDKKILPEELFCVKEEI